MFKVRGEKLVRTSSASTTHSKSGKASKMKSRPKQPQNPLIIVPESINEDDAEKMIAQNISTEMHTVVVEKKAPTPTEEETNFFDTFIYNRNINWIDMQDIKQLEGLTRAHVILAIMIGPGSSEYTNHLMKAYYSLSRLIWQAVENSMQAVKEIAKLNASTEANTVMDKNKKSNASDAGAGKKGAATGANAKNSKAVKTESGASGYLPQTLEQWSQFEVSEEIYGAWYVGFFLWIWIFS